MSNALVISEDLEFTDQINYNFERMGWTTENATLISMLAQGSTLVNNKSCSILVIDNEFGRYCSLINEMRPIIREYSRHAPLYLILKGEYDRIFETWVTYAKRTFQSVVHPQTAAMAISEIIRLETSAVPRESYYSPMDAI